MSRRETERERERWGKTLWQYFRYTNMPWPENNKANDILTLNVYGSSGPIHASPEDASREQHWRIVWRVQCWVKRREAASHERHASRQVKWIKYTNDRSTLLCNIRPLHRRQIHNGSTNDLACSFKNFLSWEEVREAHADTVISSSSFGHCVDMKQVKSIWACGSWCVFSWRGNSSSLSHHQPSYFVSCTGLEKLSNKSNTKRARMWEINGKLHIAFFLIRALGCLTKAVVNLRQDQAWAGTLCR